MPVRFFAAQLPYEVSAQDTALSVVLGAAVPVMLDALERRKSPPYWTDRAAFELAYNDISRQQWNLLMDAREDIIQEIRALRGSAVSYDFSTATWPVGTYPGFAIKDITDTLYAPDGLTAGAKLEQIRALLEAQGAGETGMLEALQQIVLLLSV